MARTRLAPIIVLLLLPLITVALYWPGLSGPFLFDDFANLPALGKLGGVRDLATLQAYVQGGSAGPTGRPIALLSFLIDDTAWPSDPEPFKYTSLMLHVLTGLLWAWLALLLARQLTADERKAGWTALLSAALWLWHPLWISTTLYVVQRMTILATLFTLAALIGYVKGRQRLAGGHLKSGYGLISVLMPAFGVLAVFSKENAALLPLYVAVLEYTCFTAASRRELPFWRLWRSVFIVAPVLVCTAYFAWHWPGIVAGYHIRPFTLTERLLSEGRILLDYLYRLAIPRASSGGLYNDAFSLSHGWFDPPATLASWLAIAALIGAALYWRRTVPALAAGILFFFAGHIIESTFFALELYFEHRNYLPSVLLSFALAWGIVRLADARRVLAIVLAAGLLASYGALTWSRAALWGDGVRLALVWAAQAPDSIRSQQQAALALSQSGRPDLSRRILAQAIRRLPDSAELRLPDLNYACTTHTLAEGDIAATIGALGGAVYHPHLYNLMDNLVALYIGNVCPELVPAALHALIDALAGNPTTRAWRTGYVRMFHLHGKLYLHERNFREALRQFDRAFELTGDDDIALVQAAMLASAGQSNLALAHLHKARNLLLSRNSSADWRDRFAELELAISENAVTELEDPFPMGAKDR